MDHVVISLKGIFVIETKTWSKPKGRDTKIVYDGEKILIDGWTLTPDPLKQVQANSVWIRDLLTTKALPGFIAKEKTALSLEDVKMATCHLSRYIRSLR